MKTPTAPEAAALLTGIFMDDGVVPKRGAKKYIGEAETQSMLVMCCATVIEHIVMDLSEYDRTKALKGFRALCEDIENNLRHREYREK